MDLSHLNPAQREAVLTTEGPLLVLAGAGSGKTRVITHRVEYLLDKGVAAENIVAISFTNKAADEMRSRLQRMVGKERADGLVLGTFHALGLRMMRERPADFDLPKRFSIIDQGDQNGIVRSLLDESGLAMRSNDSRYDAAAVLQRISLWKNDFLEQHEVEDRARSSEGTDYDDVAAQIYSEYDERLRSLAALDFDDLVVRVAACLEANPEAQEYWSSRFRYLLVDEYQDANQAQFKMLTGMLDPAQNICVVGDDDQAIYGWRGAKVANILGFDMYFPNAKVIKLEENYRCLPPIVQCANSVIEHNTMRHDKQLLAQRTGGDKVTLVACGDDVQADRWVGQRIRKMIKEQGVAPGDIAVLYRSSRLAKPIQAELETHGLAYQVLGGQQFFDRKEVKDVAAYLKVIVSAADDLALRRALDVPTRGIGRKSLERLQSFAESNNTTLLGAVHHSHEIDGITGRGANALRAFSVQVHKAHSKLREGKSMVAVLRDWVKDVGLYEDIRKKTGSAKAAATRWQNVEWLYQSMERFESKHAGKKRLPWREFVHSLEMPREAEDDEGVEGVITMATMHSAKGMEWPKVFIIGCEEGVMPHKRVEAPRVSDAISGDIDEERRLFYVGITRARDELFLIRAEKRNERGREVEIKPSRFLAEIPDDQLNVHDVNRDEKLSGDDFEAMADAFLSSLMTPGDTQS